MSDTPNAQANSVFPAHSPLDRLASSWESPDSFFEVLSEVISESDDRSIIQTLVILHQNLGKNILSRSFLLQKDHHAFWGAFSPLLRAAAQVTPSAEEFLRLLVHFKNEMGDDGAVGLVIGLAKEFCSTKTCNGVDFLDHCCSVPAERSQFIPSGIVGLSTQSFPNAHACAIALCRESDLELASSGVFALGLLDYKGHHDELVVSINTLKSLTAQSDLAIQISTIRSIGNLLTQSPNAELEELIVVASGINNPAQQFWVAHVLHDRITRHTEPWFRLAMENITSMPIASVTGLSPVDRLLTNMLQKDADAVLAYLDAWASKQEFRREMFVFKSLRRALLSHPAELQRFITHWFASDSINCHHLAANLVADFHLHLTHDQPYSSLTLDPVLISQCSPEDMEYIIRKVIGHCFVYPKEMASLIFSVLKCRKHKVETDELLHRYFLSVVFYNFPGTSASFLNLFENKGSIRQRRVAKEIQTSAESYFKTLRDLPHLNEFDPSLIRLHKYQLAQNRQMQTSMKQTEESGEFIFTKLAKKMPMKAGRAFFFKQRTGPAKGDVVLTDAMPMKEFTFNFETPRRLSFDPVGCEYDLLIMRTESRKGA